MLESPPTTTCPDVLAVDAAGVAKLLGISESHLFAMRRAGRFGPRPTRLGRSCRFLVSELRAWAEAGAPSAAAWRPARGGRP